MTTNIKGGYFSDTKCFFRKKLESKQFRIWRHVENAEMKNTYLIILSANRNAVQGAVCYFIHKMILKRKVFLEMCNKYSSFSLISIFYQINNIKYKYRKGGSLQSHL